MLETSRVFSLVSPTPPQFSAQELWFLAVVQQRGGFPVVRGAEEFAGPV